MSLNKKSLLATVKEIKANPRKRKFTQSIDLILNLQDIDLKSPTSRFQETVELPFVSEKPNKICVFASGGLGVRARRAHADLVIDRTELEQMAGSKRDLRKIANEYSSFIAEAPFMPLVGKIFGPFLGPRGKMPVPVAPTVDITKLIAKHRKTVLVKMRNQPVIQCRVGIETMNEEEITANVQAVVTAVARRLKRGLKNVKSGYLKASMGHPVQIKL